LPTTIPGDAGAARLGGTLGAVNGWAVAAGVAVLALAAVRELVRWRGRRWQKSGPRGTD
jgi:hypothetical protein